MRKKIHFTILFAFFACLAGSTIQAQVINEIYIGGGNAGAIYTNDAIILKGTPNASLSGWSVQYASAAGSSWGSSTISFNAAAVFDANGYFHIQMGSGGANGIALPNPPFGSGGGGANSFTTAVINMSATGGKLALASSTTALSGTCPTGGAIVDFVGYGTAGCWEGSGAAAVPSNPATQSMKRNGADTNNNNTDFSPNVTPLPIELLDFQAQKQAEIVLLNWSTGAERNNDYFSVERSADGQNYTEIALVKGAVNSNERQPYTYTDRTPNKGLNYYRLKQVDTDGAFEYSPVQSVRMGTQNTVLLAPNPLHEGRIATLYIDAATEDDLHLTIFNTLGQVMLQQHFTVQKGKNTLTTDLGSLPKGLYSVQVQAGAALPETQQLVVD